MRATSSCGLRGAHSLALAATAVTVLALSLLLPDADARAGQLVPAIGSYKASGRGDPSRYSVGAQVRRRAGQRKISVQVKDSCGGLATFPHTAIRRDGSGAPTFSVRLGAARASGRWTSSTRIEGSVKTLCGASQAYVMRMQSNP